MLRRSRAVLALLLVLVLSLGVVAAFAVSNEQLQAAERYQSLAAREKEWILSWQTEEGLILYQEWGSDDGAKEQVVVPYFSSIAAWGLLAGTVTPEQARGAERYLTWYMDHLNTWEDDPVNGDGTIYDYLATWDEGQVSLHSTGAYDSVDSYAALFLIVADCYAQKVDPEPLRARSADVRRVADALLRCIGDNGLAFVKKEYPVQYLMDNAEVYAGLLAGARLLQQVSPEDAAIPLMQQAAERMKQVFEELLWNGQAGMYEVGLMDDGDPVDSVSWEEFYPDSTAQLFTIIFDVIDTQGDRAKQLYSTFSSEWDWAEFEHVKSGESAFYWCFLCYAAVKQGDEARLQQFLRSYAEALEANGRGYPLYSGDAGWVALACGQMESYYRDFL